MISMAICADSCVSDDDDTGRAGAPSIQRREPRRVETDERTTI